MTEAQIWEVIEAFGAAARRALQAGCRIVAVHGAHGYLIHSFASPASNKRTDRWGGSFENRTRFGIEIIRCIRRNVPPETLLFWKISAVDWLPPGQGWEMEDTLRYAPLLAAEGVDMMDVSSGGTDRRQKVEMGPQYQVKFAQAVKELKVPGFYVSSGGTDRRQKVEMGPQYVALMGSPSSRVPRITLTPSSSPLQRTTCLRHLLTLLPVPVGIKSSLRKRSRS